jgi:membrane protein insertase Oxa1/YidC/SpoIIIJ
MFLKCFLFLFLFIFNHWFLLLKFWLMSNTVKIMQNRVIKKSHEEIER